MIYSYTLLIFACILGNYGLVKLINFRKKIYSFLVIVLFTGAIFILATWITPEKKPHNEGVLLFSTVENISTILEIGNSGTQFIWEGENGKPIFDFGDEQYITIEKINGDLSVSTKLKNKDGDQLIEIINNEWKVAVPPKIWDRNYSNDAFELKDSRGKIVLQIVLLSDRVQMQGEWWLSPTKAIQIVSHGEGKGAAYTYITPKFPNSGIEIKPIFNYPSSKHFGERIN